MRSLWLYVKGKTYVQIALFTFFGMSGLAWLTALTFHDHDFLITLSSGKSIFIQVPMGLAMGLLFAIPLYWFIQKDWFVELLEELQPRLLWLNSGQLQITLVSLAVAIGEELLFRAAIQPLFGLIPTAILFVTLHGYIRLKWGTNNLIAIYLVFFAVALGLLFQDFGIHAAIAAHFIYNWVAFQFLRRRFFG